MNKIYLILGAVFALFTAYFFGSRIATEKCRAKFVTENNANIQTIIELKGKINAETNHTATVDIRRRLHDKYTIKD